LDEEESLVRYRVLLFCVLLVAVALMAFGCTFSWIPDFDDDEEDEVNTVAYAFMDALRNQNRTAMEGLLAAYVTSINDVDWINVQEGSLARTTFASTWTGLLGHSDLDVGALQFVQGPSTAVYGESAVSIGKIRLTLNHPASWFNDWRLGITDTYPVEDIYPVRLELDETGFSWKITSFTLYQGERQTEFLNAWATFAQGFDNENADTMLSVCANPFYWTGEPMFADVGTHDEWREMLPEFFAIVITDLMSLAEMTPIQLDSRYGAFRIRIDTGSRLIDAEATMIYDGYEWLLSGLHFVSGQ